MEIELTNIFELYIALEIHYKMVTIEYCTCTNHRSFTEALKIIPLYCNILSKIIYCVSYLCCILELMYVYLRNTARYLL